MALALEVFGKWSR